MCVDHYGYIKEKEILKYFQEYFLINCKFL